MDNFQTEYLHLLRLQVDDEIKFLVDNGHSSKANFKPCMFCYEIKAGAYSCNRLGELRQFQSSIAVANTRQITHERTGIVFEPKVVDITHLELPQLMQPL